METIKFDQIKTPPKMKINYTQDSSNYNFNVGLKHLLKYNILNEMQLNNLLNKYNGLEVYNIITSENLSNNEIINNGLNLYLQLKFNVKIHYHVYDAYNVMVYINHDALLSYFCNYDNLPIDIIKKIYNELNLLNIKRIRSMIIFDDKNNKEKFINEYNKIITEQGEINYDNY